VTLTASRKLEQREHAAPRADEAKADPHTATPRPPQAPAPASPEGAAQPLTLAAATETVPPTRSPQPPLARTHSTPPSATRPAPAEPKAASTPVAPASAAFEPQPAEQETAGQGWRRLFAGVRRRLRRDDAALQSGEEPPAGAPVLNAAAEASQQPAEQVPAAPADPPVKTPLASASPEPSAPDRRPPTAPASEPPPATAAFSAPTVTPEPPAARAPEHGSDDVEAVLSAVLDALGSAHHRPFSRS
jgi:hypothetical protein